MTQKLKLVTSAALAVLCLTPAALAQEAGSGADDEIVVTATRRAQSILDVPQSVQAIGGDLIEDLAIDDVEDIAALTPNLNIETNRKFGGRFNIRGFGDQEGAFTAFSTVGTYIDDTPLTDARANLEAALFDVQRVEVLRGPQGTLYGEGSLAGTVRIITNQPDVDAYEGVLVARAETTEDGEPSYRLAGVANIPFAPGVAALRITASRDDTGGFMDAGPWPTGTPVSEDVNGGTADYLRAAVQWHVTNAITLRPSFSYEKIEAQAGPLDSIALPGLVGYSNGPDGFDDELQIFALEAEIDLGWATLTSSTSYYERDFHSIDDDLGANTVIDLYIAPSVATTQDFQRQTETTTQEFRLVSADNGPLTWLAGAFYRHKEMKEDTIINSETIESIVGDPRTFLQDNQATFEQYAVFGEVNYAITDRLTVTGGARWFNEEATSTLRFGVFDLGVFGFVLNPEITPDFSEDGMLFKAAATYELTDDLTFYALYSEGYRPGGVNDRLVDLGGTLTPAQLEALSTYERDETTNYEAGLKGRFFNNRLSANLSVFRIDWDGTQVATQPIPGANIVVNAEGARSIGFEADAAFDLTDNFRIGTAVGYADAEIIEDTPSASGLIPEGSALPHAPLWSGSVFADYVHPLGEGRDLRFRADARYTGERQNRVDIVGQPGTPLEAYTIVNALAAYETETWSLNLYVNNLTNELAELNALMFNDPLVGDLVAGYVRNRPRTVGLQLRVEF
jgi:outer membrane receptor protein involved in Fe transport